MKTRYKLVLFDLDGTLLNTYEGIVNSYKYAAIRMNFSQPSAQMLSTAIGAPLKDVFIREYKLNEILADEAIKYYRDYYREKGQFEVFLYDGIEDVLRELRDMGVILGVATLKMESFARDMLEECGILKYFDCVMGMNNRDSLTKSILVQKCIDFFSVSSKEVVLIGDSCYDKEGAEMTNVSFIGITYGFGYKKGDILLGDKVLGMANKPTEILDLLID